MITLTWGHLKNEQFMQSLGSIYQIKMGFDYAKRVVKIVNAIKAQGEESKAVHDKILQKLGTPNPNQPGAYDIAPEKRAEYNKEMDAYHANEFTIDTPKFDPKKLSELVLFSPMDLVMLEPLFISETNLSAVKNEEPMSDNKESPQTH